MQGFRPRIGAMFHVEHLAPRREIAASGGKATALRGYALRHAGAGSDSGAGRVAWPRLCVAMRGATGVPDQSAASRARPSSHAGRRAHLCGRGPMFHVEHRPQ